MCTPFHLENTEFGSQEPNPVKANPSLTDYLYTNFWKMVLKRNQTYLWAQTLLKTFEISPAASELCL